LFVGDVHAISKCLVISIVYVKLFFLFLLNTYDLKFFD